ncbi:peptide ligase PGM1-related protein [Ruminiclostridium sufflavum]|nr:ATP-grasp domain-containing protein [Ruminiclostridium sufflavum]
MNTGVVDRNEDAIVNRIEEMNLLICREQDYIILRKRPDEKYLNVLKEMGFSIPRILTPKNADLLTPVSELVQKDEELLEELREISAQNEEVYFSPYAVTYMEERIAEMAGLTILGAPSYIGAKVNDKIFNREISEKLGFAVCQGKVCRSVDEIREEYDRLTNSPPYFRRIIIKEPNGASGKGLYVISDKEKLESNLRIIARFARKKTDAMWLVEGWYDKKADLNYQIYISPSGAVDVFSIKQQLLNDTVYIGSKIPPDLDEEVLKSYRQYGEKIGKYLFEEGYTGVAGIDSIITTEDVIIPIIEINGRFTLSTYISFINNQIKDINILSRYYRLISDSAVSYENISREIDKEGALLKPGEREGVFVYTSGTLPEVLHDGQDKYMGRVFALIISDSWNRIDEYSSRLDKVIQSLSR